MFYSAQLKCKILSKFQIFYVQCFTLLYLECRSKILSQFSYVLKFLTRILHFTQITQMQFTERKISMFYNNGTEFLKNQILIFFTLQSLIQMQNLSNLLISPVPVLHLVATNRTIPFMFYSKPLKREDFEENIKTL